MLVSGTLADGLAVHTTTGTFSGTASTVRNHSFTIAATDTALATNIATYTLAVPAGKPGAPVIGTATTGDGEADVAFTAPASNHQLYCYLNLATDCQQRFRYGGRRFVGKSHSVRVGPRGGQTELAVRN